MKLTLIASAVADIISKAKKACIYNSFSLHKGITDEGIVTKANPDFGKLAIASKNKSSSTAMIPFSDSSTGAGTSPVLPPTR